MTLRWAKVIDHERCIGCHACTTACKSENEVPLSVTRTYVKYVEVGTFPQARRAFQVTRCNQCDDAPCTVACPTTAMFRRPDGIVDFDKSACIGCKACIAACPYDAIFINPEDHSAEKCNFCAHRIDVGLEPACVIVCPAEAILVGDMNDPSSKVAQIIHRDAVAVRRPEKETRPKLFYKGVTQATLDPLAARRPGGGLFLWSEQQRGGEHVVSGHPDHGAAQSQRSPANSSAAALLAYDVGHSRPWDWRVSLYTVTKGIAAGAYLVAALLVLFGLLPGDSALFRWTAPLLSLAALAVTGALLIWDLEHPERFYFLFTRPQWKSWLVKGAVILAGYGLLLSAHLVAAFAGGSTRVSLLRVFMIPGIPLAAMAAVYTAYLLAQAKARDLWQSPLLPAQLLIQAGLAGSAALLLLALTLAPAALPGLLWVLAATSGIHLLLVWGETTLPHVTAHAHLACREMTRGDFAPFFWTGVVLGLAGIVAPLGGSLAPLLATAALAGLLAYEHSYIQAGQSVPLA